VSRKRRHPSTIARTEEEHREGYEVHPGRTGPTGGAATQKHSEPEVRTPPEAELGNGVNWKIIKKES